MKELVHDMPRDVIQWIEEEVRTGTMGTHICVYSGGTGVSQGSTIHAGSIGMNAWRLHTAVRGVVLIGLHVRCIVYSTTLACLRHLQLGACLYATMHWKGNNVQPVQYMSRLRV